MSLNFPLESHKLIFVVVFLLCAGLSNWVTLALIHDHVGRTALPDITFYYVPEMLQASIIGDLMVIFCVISLVFLILLHKHGLIVMRRTFFIFGMLYLFRTFSMLFTQLPSAYKNNNIRCQENVSDKDKTFSLILNRVIIQTINVGFQNSSEKMLCGDLLYSGHTLIMVISSLTISHYLPNSIRFLRYAPKFFMIVGMICMIISRTHYTIDVFFAYCFSVGVFSLYHAFCEIDTYCERKNSILKKILFMNCVFWLEENVIPGRIENKLEIPFFKTYKELTEYLKQNNTTNKHKSKNCSSAAIRNA